VEANVFFGGNGGGKGKNYVIFGAGALKGSRVK
jgi:hypothetical protein